MTVEMTLTSSAVEQKSAFTKQKPEGNLPDRFMPSTSNLSLVEERAPDQPLPPIDCSRFQSKNVDLPHYTKSHASSTPLLQQSYPEMNAEEKLGGALPHEAKSERVNTLADDELRQSVITLNRVTADNSVMLRDLSQRLNKVDSQNYSIVEAVNKMKEEVEALKTGKARNTYSETHPPQSRQRAEEGKGARVPTEREASQPALSSAAYPSYPPGGEERKQSLTASARQGQEPGQADARDYAASSQIPYNRSFYPTTKLEVNNDGSTVYGSSYRAGAASQAPSRQTPLASAQSGFAATTYAPRQEGSLHGGPARPPLSSVGADGAGRYSSYAQLGSSAVGDYHAYPPSSVAPPVITSVRSSTDRRVYPHFASAPAMDYAFGKNEVIYAAPGPSAGPAPICQSFYHRHGYNAPHQPHCPAAGGFRSYYHAAPQASETFSAYQSRFGRPGESLDVHEHKVNTFSSYTTTNRSSSLPPKESAQPEFLRGAGGSELGGHAPRFPGRAQQPVSQPPEKRSYAHGQGAGQQVPTGTA